MIARSLVVALREAGYQSEIWTTPQNRFGRQFSAYAATRFTDVEWSDFLKVDRLISLRFPSYVLRHPYHVCWLNHRMREYYDLWPELTQSLRWYDKAKERIRRSFIHAADHYYLTHLKKLFAQSKNVQAGLQRWGKISSELLYPPPPIQRTYFTESYGDFILSPARLTPLKRVPLLVEALALCPTGKVAIVGAGPESVKIAELVTKYSLQDRVEMKGHVDDEHLSALYAKCKAVYYAPVNEDYGLVAVEAFRARKPVLTATDSGGVLDVVTHMRSGFVVKPQPEEIALQIRRVFEESKLAETLGSAGYEDTKHITWPDTIQLLMSS